MKNFHSILRCNSRSHSRSFPGITTSHSRSRNAGMEFPFPFPKIGNGIFPFPFPKVGNEIFHSRSRSQITKSHSRSPLPTSKEVLVLTFSSVYNKILIISPQEELMNHLKVHAGSRTMKGSLDKKFVCGQCDKKFFTRKDLKRHR